MKILKIDDYLGNEDLAVDQVVEVLRNDGIVMIPSDTCYGFSASINSSSAKTAIANFKKQKKEKPLTILISNLNQLYDLCHVSSLAAELIEEFWPGPLTLLLPSLNGSEYIGVRMPDHNLSKILIDKLDSPVFSTSANLHGCKEVYHLDELNQQYNNNLEGLDLILDVGMLDFKRPSTILKIVGDKLELIREGDLWGLISQRF